MGKLSIAVGSGFDGLEGEGDAVGYLTNTIWVVVEVLCLAMCGCCRSIYVEFIEREAADTLVVLPDVPAEGAGSGKAQWPDRMEELEKFFRLSVSRGHDGDDLYGPPYCGVSAAIGCMSGVAAAVDRGRAGRASGGVGHMRDRLTWHRRVSRSGIAACSDSR